LFPSQETRKGKSFGVVLFTAVFKLHMILARKTMRDPVPKFSENVLQKIA